MYEGVSLENLTAYLQHIDLLDAEGHDSGERIASLVLNRPDSANSFSGDLLLKLTDLLLEVAGDRSVRVLLVQGSGKHFSAGADLHWMKQASQMDFAGNLAEAEKLTCMFEALAKLKIPTIAMVKGAAFGGAVGLIAACDYALALDQAKFCLSEVKIGLIPAVILPYLARKLPSGQLHRYALSAQVFSASEAEAMGLIQKVVNLSEAEEELRLELEGLLLASPEAQSAFKKLFSSLADDQFQQSPQTAHAIASIRASKMGQQGLHAFFQKTAAPWVRKIPRSRHLLIP